MLTWNGETDIHACVNAVRRAVTDPYAVAAWSAYSSSAGLHCAVEEGDEESATSRIVFRDGSGMERGYRQLIDQTANRVEYRFQSSGRSGRVVGARLIFDVEPLSATRTRVRSSFRADVPLPAGPRFVIKAMVSKYVSALNAEDLRRLKVHVEDAYRVEEPHGG